MSDGKPTPAELTLGLSIRRRHVSGDELVSTPVTDSEFFAPPCEHSFRGRLHHHPRWPSGDCVVCGALATEDCQYEARKAQR